MYLDKKRYIEQLSNVDLKSTFDKWKYYNLINVYIIGNLLLFISSWYSFNFYLDNGFGVYGAVSLTVSVSIILGVSSKYFVSDFINNKINTFALGVCILIFAWNVHADFKGSNGIVESNIERPEDLNTEKALLGYNNNISSLEAEELGIYVKYSWIHKDSSLAWLKANIYIPKNGNKWHLKSEVTKDLARLGVLSKQRDLLLSNYINEKASILKAHEINVKAYDTKVSNQVNRFKLGAIAISLMYILSIFFRIKFDIAVLSEIEPKQQETDRETVKETRKPLKVDISDATQDSIIKLVLEGYSNDEICKKLNISKGTVTKSKQKKFFEYCNDDQLLNEDWVNEVLNKLKLSSTNFIDKYKKEHKLNGYSHA